MKFGDIRTWVFVVNGNLPTNISYVITPRLHQSTLNPYSTSLNISKQLKENIEQTWSYSIHQGQYSLVFHKTCLLISRSHFLCTFQSLPTWCDRHGWASRCPISSLCRWSPYRVETRMPNLSQHNRIWFFLNWISYPTDEIVVNCWLLESDPKKNNCAHSEQGYILNIQEAS